VTLAEVPWHTWALLGGILALYAAAAFVQRKR
jgi:hypothetical protein